MLSAAAVEADPASLFRLGGQRLVVLGAGSGLGELVSRFLAALQADLLLVDIEPGVEDLAARLDAPAVVADITAEAGMGVVADAARDLGAVHGYVDVVGRMQRERLPEFTLAQWQEDFRVNLTHAFLAAQSLMPLIVASGGGAVVHVSSTMASRAGPSSPGYGPAKAALEAWVRQLAGQYGPAGIRVNAVAPGLFESPRFLATPGSEAVAAHCAQHTMLGQLGQPAQVAATIAFLLSPAAGYITGTVLPIDGGATAMDTTGLEGIPLHA